VYKAIKQGLDLNSGVFSRLKGADNKPLGQCAAGALISHDFGGFPSRFRLRSPLQIDNFADNTCEGSGEP
jgi:hypothetical protein